jgi:hypothetical protein
MTWSGVRLSVLPVLRNCLSHHRPAHIFALSGDFDEFIKSLNNLVQYRGRPVVAAWKLFVYPLAAHFKLYHVVAGRGV